ncbi:MAG: hypothetical protein MJ202_01710 [Lentisphaeria bacterium]|nr:hypothetical protein [Lentisphaeria bacterium]
MKTQPALPVNTISDIANLSCNHMPHTVRPLLPFLENGFITACWICAIFHDSHLGKENDSFSAKTNKTVLFHKRTESSKYLKTKKI